MDAKRHEEQVARERLFKSLKQAPHGIMAPGVGRDAVRGFFTMLLGLSALAVCALYLFPLLAK